MELTMEEVNHVATLARLGLTPAEKLVMRDQLSSILEHISALNELDTSAIPPTAQVGSLVNVMRDDVVTGSLSQQEVLMNAPRQRDGFFEVDSPLAGESDVS